MNEIIKNLQNLRSDKERQKVILDGEIKNLTKKSYIRCTKRQMPLIEF